MKKIKVVFLLLSIVLCVSSCSKEEIDEKGNKDGLIYGDTDSRNVSDKVEKIFTLINKHRKNISLKPYKKSKLCDKVSANHNEFLMLERGYACYEGVSEHIRTPLRNKNIQTYNYAINAIYPSGYTGGVLTLPSDEEDVLKSWLDGTDNPLIYKHDSKKVIESDNYNYIGISVMKSDKSSGLQYIYTITVHE